MIELAINPGKSEIRIQNIKPQTPVRACMYVHVYIWMYVCV